MADWDVLSYSPVTGQLTVQVKIPLLATTRPIRIFGCAGNSVVTTFQGGAQGAAYDNNYLLALHMDETSGTILHDSTANADDAVKKGSANPNPTPTAVLGGAQNFVGTTNSTNNDYALFGAPTAPADTYTVEYWTNATSFINTDAVFLESDGAGGGPVVYMGFYWYPGVARFVNSWNTGFFPFEPGGANVAPGAFHYIVFMRNGDTVTMYVDGVAGPPLAGYGLQAEEWSALGWNGGANAVFNSYNGILDEVFYSNIARGPDYVTARYNNIIEPVERVLYGQCFHTRACSRAVNNPGEFPGQYFHLLRMMISMKLRSLFVSSLLLMAIPAAMLAQASVLGVTPTQAVLHYQASGPVVCQVQVSQNTSMTPLAADVDPTLFPGANLDSRAGSSTSGSDRYFLVGKRRADLATDGKHYSRALQAFTEYFYQVTCGTSVQSGRFVTADPPLGNNYPEPPPFDATEFGNYAWPTINWNDQTKSYIDPMTGILIKRATGPGWYGATQNCTNHLLLRWI